MVKKFKLQSVLNYRQSLEDQAKQNLSASLQRKKLMEEELEHQRQSVQQLDSELKERQQEGMTIAEIELFESQIQHRQRLYDEIQQQLEQLERQILNEREELLKTSRERQIMDKLKEKQEAEFLKELNRKERETLDEISLRNKGDQS